MKTKNILDSATQSASSIMLENLYKNSFFFSDRNYINLIEDIIKNNWARVRSGPISYIGFLKAAHLVISEPNFIVLFKKDGFYKEIKDCLLKFNTFFTLSFIKKENMVPKKSPAYGKKLVNNKTTVYVCGRFTCSSPISNMEEMTDWFNKNSFIKI